MASRLPCGVLRGPTPPLHMVLNYPRLYPHIEDTIYHIHIRLLCIHRASVNKFLIPTGVSTFCWRSRQRELSIHRLYIRPMNGRAQGPLALIVFNGYHLVAPTDYSTPTHPDAPSSRDICLTSGGSPFRSLPVVHQCTKALHVINTDTVTPSLLHGGFSPCFR